MGDDDLKKLFDEADAQPVDPMRKQASLSAAMAEFDAAHKKSVKSRQGFWQRLRLMFGNATEQPDRERSETMNRFDRRWAYSGFATASVLAVAVMIAYDEKPQDEFVISKSKTADSIEWLPGEDAKAELDRASRERTAENEAQFEQLEEVLVTASMAEPQESPDQALPARQEGEKALADAPVAKRQPQPQMQPKVAAESFAAGQAVMSLAAPSADHDIRPPQGYKDIGRDQFERVETNPVKKVAEEPVSTFSIDVDTASYSFVRRQLNSGVLPQKDAVRVEEMLNYFDYAYPLPDNKETPFSTTINVTDSPWTSGNRLIHIGIKGYELPRMEMPRTNLVFLLDVSGSMNSPDKLSLVKQSMELLLSQLNPDDTVAIAVYAGAAGTVLEPTKVSDKSKILGALNRLQAGGSTAGGQGLKLAYQLAESHFDRKAVNRIILATDGDFNVGITNRDELKGFVERKKDKGIFLSVLGFGQGNYNDHLMQELAQNGNGVAAYIDTLSEAQKVLVDQATSMLFTIAKDVKIQMEFNPQTVSEYRLLGYETRHLNREDFNNDAVDAGDIGAGHSVTAIYEITPVGGRSGLIDDLRYGENSGAAGDKARVSETDIRLSELGYLKLRYKLPEETVSKLISQPIPLMAENASPAMQRETSFATAVAGFAQLLKGGEYTGDWGYDDALNLAQSSKGDDLYGYRTELVQLIRKAKTASEM
ncbi:MAG: vWA domain-containing protein [bacterium]